MTTSFNPPTSRRPANEDGFVVGSVVGRYRLLALIASGGMAHVWAAEPLTSGGMSRTIALKVIRPDLASDPEYARLFIDEATIATAVRHPNVCQTFELNRHENVLFMAMEWVPGDCLAGLIRNGNRFWPLDVDIAARICADAAAGLHAAHEATDEKGNPLGVIHRDVSPANVLISTQGQVKVSDFGIAKARHQLHERTRTGEVKGKFAYLAPEQIAGGPTDRRVDIYALGCVLYTATLGLRPFGNGPEAMPKILLGEFRRPRDIDPTYPPGLEDIILKALQQRPEDRYQTANEMREAIESWLWETSRLVTQADVAAMAKERLSPETQEAIFKLRNRTRVQAEVAYQMLRESLDMLEPPTTSTGVLVPEEVRARSRSSRSPDPGDDEADATRIVEFDPFAALDTGIGPRQTAPFSPQDLVPRKSAHAPLSLGPKKALGGPPMAAPRRRTPTTGGTGRRKRSSKKKKQRDEFPAWLGPVGFGSLALSIAYWLISGGSRF